MIRNYNNIIQKKIKNKNKAGVIMSFELWDLQKEEKKHLGLKFIQVKFRVLRTRI